MYARLGIIALLAAGIPALILDGQTFRNALISLGLVLTSAAIAYVGARRRDVSDQVRRECGWIFFGGAVLTVGLVAILPREYAAQKNFNQQREQIRRINGPCLEMTPRTINDACPPSRAAPTSPGA